MQNISLFILTNFILKMQRRASAAMVFSAVSMDIWWYFGFEDIVFFAF